MIINELMVKKNESNVFGTGEFRVRFIDYDGTVIRTCFVDSGNDATPPPDPNHASENIFFDEWNQAYTNITEDRDVGAIFETSDGTNVGRTYAHVRLTVETGKLVLLAINKSDTSTLYIDWGDGNHNTYTFSGDDEPTHTYTNYGDYKITLYISSGTGFWYLGQGREYNETFELWEEHSFCGDATDYRRNMLRKLYIGNDVRLNEAGAYACKSLEVVTMPSDLTFDIENYGFYRCHSLKALIIPDGFLSVPSNFCVDCYSLQVVSFPDTLTDIGTTAFDECRSLSILILPSAVEDIGSGAFRDCSGIKTIKTYGDVDNIRTGAFQDCMITTYVFSETTPPTLGSTSAFSNILHITKIYVPNASLSTYKAATNWSNFEDQIYSINDKGVTHDD
jgi:hypothetical protein